MPIYEYKCTKCGHEFEVIQKFSDKPLKKCIECKGKVEKLISQSSFVLKGEGWYQTDYAKKDRPKETKKTEPKTTESSTGSESSACAKCPASDAK